MKTYGMKEHAQLVKSVLKSHGFKAELTTTGNVKVSLKNHGFRIRNLTSSEVLQVIHDEELPIDDRQVSGSTTIFNHALHGIVRADAVLIRL